MVLPSFCLSIMEENSSLCSINSVSFYLFRNRKGLIIRIDCKVTMGLFWLYLTKVFPFCKILTANDGSPEICILTYDTIVMETTVRSCLYFLDFLPRFFEFQDIKEHFSSYKY